MAENDDNLPTVRPVEQALAGGSPQRMGEYRFYFDDERWHWSEQVQRMHGYEPGTVTPTTQMVLAHKHPDDRVRVAATIDEIRRTRRPFSTRHRIVDAHGKERDVVVVSDLLRDDVGAVIGTHGFYIDITADTDRRQEMITEQIAEIVGRRAAIEQAKGMLMVIYGVDTGVAFELLRWQSAETNTKLRALAQQIVADFCAQARHDDPPGRDHPTIVSC